MVRSWLWNYKQSAMNIMACASWRNYCCSCESFGGDSSTLAQLCREKWAPNNFLAFQSFSPRPNSPRVFAAPLPKLSSRKRSRRLRRLWLLQISEVQWSQDNAMFSVFSHYAGCCVDRIWHATVLRIVTRLSHIGRPKPRPTGPSWRPAISFQRESAPRLSQSLPEGLDSQPSAVSLCWLHLDMIWAILLDWGLWISAVWSIL